MTKIMVDEVLTVLREFYGMKYSRELASNGLNDGLISRYEYARITGAEAPKGVRGLVADESPTNERALRCGGCGNCGYCCD